MVLPRWRMYLLIFVLIFVTNTGETRLLNHIGVYSQEVLSGQLDEAIGNDNSPRVKGFGQNSESGSNTVPMSPRNNHQPNGKKGMRMKRNAFRDVMIGGMGGAGVSKHGIGGARNQIDWVSSSPETGGSLNTNLDKSRKKMGGLSKGIGAGMNGFGAEMNGMRGPMNGMGGSMNGVGGAMNGIGGAMNGIGAGMNGINGLINGMDGAMNAMGEPRNGMHGPMNGIGKLTDGMGGSMNSMSRPMNGMVGTMNGIDAGMNGMNGPMNGVGGPMNGMGGPMNGMGGAMSGIGAGMNGINGPMNGMGGPMNGMGGPMNGMGGPMNGMGGAMNAIGEPMNEMHGTMNGIGGPMNGMHGPMNGIGEPMNGMGGPMNTIGRPMNGMGGAMNGMSGTNNWMKGGGSFTEKSNDKYKVWTDRAAKYLRSMGLGTPEGQDEFDYLIDEYARKNRKKVKSYAETRGGVSRSMDIYRSSNMDKDEMLDLQITYNRDNRTLNMEGLKEQIYLHLDRSGARYDKIEDLFNKTRKGESLSKVQLKNWKENMSEAADKANVTMDSALDKVLEMHQLISLGQSFEVFDGDHHLTTSYSDENQQHVRICLCI